MVLVGDAKGKIAVLIDDMADTCGTIVQVQNVVKILEIIPQFFFGRLSSIKIFSQNNVEKEKCSLILNSSLLHYSCTLYSFRHPFSIALFVHVLNGKTSRLLRS